MANYAFKEPPEVENGHEFVNVNFTRAVPNTKIFEGVTGLVFNNCNLMNCDVPEDAEIISGLHCHVSFCSYVHPSWVDKGVPECGVSCQHLVDTHTITIDGVVVDETPEYQDKPEV